VVDTTLGPYKIEEQLGAGGMGEVYLAKDTRLGRKVAIKVLPEEFAGDPERLARFEQEARAAAALNHPNIATVHDVGIEEGTHFIVQEYLAGHSLRSTLDAGPLPLKRTLVLATEIAEALRAAHNAGIVHRDLKPDNIFVTEDGRAKVLDFGLAKLTESAAAPLGSQSMSPTVVGTRQGAIMGTAGYMAPEQVDGREVDARADLFAFGCVLYEMASGRRPFQGQNVYETLGRIVSNEPEPLESGAVPVGLQRVIRKCLAKDPAERAQSAGDLTVDLKMLARDLEGGAVGLESTPATTATRARTSPVLLGIVAFASLLAGALAVWLLGDAPDVDHAVTELGVELAGKGIDLTFGPGAMLSPNGRLIAMAVEEAMAGSDGGLYLRSLDGGVPELLVERSVDNPVFSVDSTWIAYEQNGVLWKLPVAGGASIRLVDVPSDRGTWWMSDGSLLVVPTAADGVLRLPPDGDELVPVTTLRDGEAAQRWPQALPGETHILFVADDDGVDWTDATIEVAEIATGERKLIARGGYYPRYVSSGHVLYASGSSLFALPFDLDRLEATGPAFRVLEGVTTNSTVGSAQYSVSDDGTLLYLPGGDEMTDFQMRLVAHDRAGQPTTLGPEWQDLELPSVALHPTLSPDGRRLAYVRSTTGGDGDVWIYDIERALSSRLTLSPRLEWFPVWSRDGQYVYYALTSGDDEGGLYRRRADGTGERERVVEEARWLPWDQLPDGRLVAGLAQGSVAGRGGIAILDPVTGESEPIVGTEWVATQARVSPDGRWLVYVSDESDDFEVYVYGMEGQGRWQISDQGGAQPLFSSDGRAVYYRSGYDIVEVELAFEGDALRPGRPRVLYQATEGSSLGIAMAGTFQYDYTTFDGEVFIEAVDAMTQTAGPEQRGVIVFNWLERLRRMAAEQQ
jgi:serine/threonine-protein kinase